MQPLAMGWGRVLDSRSAIEEYSRALAVFPRYGAAQFALAEAYRKLDEPGKAEAAMRDYDRDRTLIPPISDPEMSALRALNVSPTGLMSQAAELENDGRLQEALELLNRATGMNPNLVDAYIRLKWARLISFMTLCKLVNGSKVTTFATSGRLLES